MHLGFALFESLTLLGCQTYEVFPTAAYTQLAGSDLRMTLHLGGLSAGPKDMMEAHIAAFTVREYLEGRGCSVGGGDGLGEIVLPVSVSRESLVHVWPGQVIG